MNMKGINADDLRFARSIGNAEDSTNTDHSKDTLVSPILSSAPSRLSKLRSSLIELLVLRSSAFRSIIFKSLVLKRGHPKDLSGYLNGDHSRDVNSDHPRGCNKDHSRDLNWDLPRDLNRNYPRAIEL